MKLKLSNMIVAGALIASAGVVSASESEPLALTLTEVQMDNVTGGIGGAVAGAFSGAASFGFINSFANQNTFTNVGVVAFQGPPAVSLPVFRADSLSGSASGAF